MANQFSHRLAFLARVLCSTALVAVYPLPLYANSIFTEQAHDSNAPALLKADSLYYDPGTGRVTAEGNVEISQGERILMAQRLVYDQHNNAVYATGDVSLMEPTGQVYFAQNVALKEDLKTGIIENFRARFIDDSMLAANKASRINGNVTELQKAVYSACKLCIEKPEKAPLWQIKAKKVRVDDTAQQVTYHDAQVELYGLPVIYTPYLSHATPGADNKSGFLPPTYSTINTLGATVQVPYYISVEPHLDATVAPIFTTDEGTIMTGELRHLTENGRYQLSGSITNPQKRNDLGDRIAGHEIRGHLEGFGQFQMENDWQWGFEGKRATDDTYLRRYKFGYEDSLTSTAYINQIRGRNFIGARGLTFQGLNADDDPATTPFILPLTQTHFESRPGYLGSRLSLDTNTMVLYRSEGTQSRRLSLTGGYKLPVITPSGHLFTLSATTRGDIYSVENISTTNNLNKDDVIGRVIPELGAEWSYPMIRSFQNGGSMTVEPLASVAVSPYGNNPDEIPNEDSQNFELNDINLFSLDKFTGLDRLETGPRANYGVRTSYSTGGATTIGAMLGQSYRLKADDTLYGRSGLEDDVSNYVGRINLRNRKYYDMAYSFRLHNEDFKVARSEYSTNFYLPYDITVGADYIYLDAENTILTDDREEVLLTAGYKINDQWSIGGNARRGLGQNPESAGLISTGAGLYFQNECLGLATLFNREYTRDRDIEPSTSVILQLMMKNLN